MILVFVKHNDNLMNSISLTVKIERAISELRRGSKLVVTDDDAGTSVILVASELIENETIDELSTLGLSRPNIILSQNRCKAIGIKKANQPCSILIQSNWTTNDILSLCMPLTGHRIPEINGVLPERNKGIVSSCILLLRQARLLPAGLMTIISSIPIEKISEWAFSNNLIHVNISEIKSYEEMSAKSLKMSVKAKVPIAYTDNCEIIIFRPKDGGNEHFCLVFGKNRKSTSEPTLLRIHSQCITGDVLDSLKCDCGQQLKKSIKIMADADEGVLIYLAQEGRDIGLLNKLRAYTLQEKGMDTVEANEDLGFEDDERLYYPAKQILSQLNIKEVNLITNNPKKVQHLENLGISVIKRIPIKITPNKHNKKYLDTKSNKSGHLI